MAKRYFYRFPEGGGRLKTVTEFSVAHFLFYVIPRAADVNKDGAIDLEEFKVMLGI